MTVPRAILAVAAASALVLACASAPPPPPPPPPEPEPPPPPLEVVMWPLSPEEFRQRLEFADFDIVESKPVGAGVTGAMKWEVIFPSDGLSVPLKWKPAPPGDADGWNNAPRKELAAYQVQSWFLDAEDYIVPIAVMRCVPRARYQSVKPGAAPNIPGADCVLGQLSLWIEHVEIPEQLYDPARFREDASYAGHMADFNLLTYLVDHQDGRSGNFLVSLDPADRRVYSVDNGVAFGGYVTNVFVENWNVIRVPALRRASIERLRDLRAERLEALGVVSQLRFVGGDLRNVSFGENLDPERGARVQEGVVLQLGLKQSEIDAVQKRVDDLLSRVDRGEIPLL